MSKTQKTRTEDRLIRLWEVLELIPVSKSTWWEGVRSGKFPKAVKIGPRLTCWRFADIIEVIERGAQSPGSDPQDLTSSGGVQMQAKGAADGKL